MRTVDESLLRNPVFAELLRQAERDPLPAAHTSAHWLHYGPKTLVDFKKGGLSLRSYGFDGLDEHPLLRPLRFAERLSYRSVSRRYRHYKPVWSAGTQIAGELGGHVTSSAFAAILALALLLDHFEDRKIRISTAVIIGDGAGFLSALLRRLKPDTRLYCVDLPKMLVFQARSHLLTSKASLSVASDRGEAPSMTNFVSPDAVETVNGEIDLAINIDSMQEMNPESVERYFSFLRKRSHPNSRFYCLNRERKVFSDGTESVLSRYPWDSNDEIFIDELCPFHLHFLDWHPPFYRKFDGPSRHRLVRLSAEAISS